MGREQAARRVGVVLALVVSVALGVAWGPPGAWGQGLAAMPSATIGAGDFIVLFRDTTSQLDRARAVGRAGAVLRFNYRRISAAAIHAPSPAALAALGLDPDVVLIVPDRVVRARRKPGGGGGGGGGTGQVTPAGVTRIGAPEAWSTHGVTGAGVGVAILDTGLDLAHADLPVSTAPGASFTAYGASAQDDDAHGTHVGGIVAARDNGQDVVGVAPGATLYAVKVLDGSGNGTDSTVLAGLDWVADSADLVTPPIRVVNMSLGRDGSVDDNPVLHDMVQLLTKPVSGGGHGITVVVSAGNDASQEITQQVPAGYPEVLAIASTTATGGSNAGCRTYRATVPADTASYFTTDGAGGGGGEPGVVISAPGADKENISKSCFLQSVGILSTRLGGGTTRMSGTSMAAPHVTGVVALLWQQALAGGGSTLAPETVRARLQSSAERQGEAPLDSPARGYTYDGFREGVLSAPAALTP